MENKKFLNLKICLLGGPSTGKKSVANFLKNTFNLHVIQMEEILLKEEQTQNFLKRGEPVPDWLMIQLIKKNINAHFEDMTEEQFLAEYQKNPKFTRGWVLVDFPKTQE